jgi:CubicO group peptidase (beta-lactamase class C family)
MKTRNRILLGVAALLVASLAILHSRYPLPYIYQVFVHQSPDYSDFEMFPASRIPQSGSPSLLPVAPDPGVITLIESQPGIEDFDGFLTATDTTAFLVVHDGKIVLEQYLKGHDESSAENTFSVAKSITSALVGLAIRDGYLRLDAPITEYLPELSARDRRFEDVTIESLLNMRSGIRYVDGVTFPFFTSDDPLSYYFPRLETILLERTLVEAPPGRFQYNKYNPQFIGLALSRSADRTVSGYLGQALWEPMGASYVAGWNTDANGLERMESGFFARARDLARFGLMYLNDGEVEGRQVIPREWVRMSTDTPEHIALEKYDGRTWGYRLGWWIVPRPEGRSDYCGIGHFGQIVYVSPQYRAVFVRNGPGRGEWSDRDWTQLFYSLAGQL